MIEEQKKIIYYLTRYLETNPEQRFGQALTNLGILRFADEIIPERKNWLLRDIYHDTDEKILERVLKSFKEYEPPIN